MTSPRLPARPTRSARRSTTRRSLPTISALVALAVVASAHAPSVITVRSGDTLSELAVQHGTTVAAIKAANNRSGTTIYIGETLKIPAAGQATTTSSRTTEVGYRVRSGDTLSQIARQHGASIRSIVERNNLRSAHRIYIGQVLAIPTTTRTVAPTAPQTVSSTSARVSSEVATNRARLARMSLPSKSQARAQVAATARRYGVPVSLALAVAYQESGFQQRVVSPANAIGVMQVLPRTGRGLERVAGRELNLLDYRDNITAGVLLLRQLIRSQGTVNGALAGYYQGIGSISRKGILPVTHTYIANINALRSRFANG